MTGTIFLIFAAVYIGDRDEMFVQLHETSMNSKRQIFGATCI